MLNFVTLVKNETEKDTINSLTLLDGSRSSTSKLDVSLGLVTTGIYGAVASSEKNDEFVKI